MIQAPRANFAMAKIATTIAVVVAPRPLRNALRRHPGPRSLYQWRTMPACESVKAVKTPIA